MKLRLIALFCLSALVSNAQRMVYTDPEFFGETTPGPIHIYFDASVTGVAAGLRNLSGTGAATNFVYVHTGLITSAGSGWRHVYNPTSGSNPWGTSHELLRMERVEPNLWRWTIPTTIRQHYNVTNPNDTVRQLAFVFRTSTGGAQTADIFIDLFSGGFEMRINSPQRNQFFDVGDSVEFSVQTSSNSDLTFYLNGTEIASATGVTELGATHKNLLNENYKFLVKAENTGFGTFYDSLNFNVRSATVDAPLPAGVRDGINITGDSAVTLVLRAPIAKNSIYAIGDFNNWAPSKDYQLKKDSIFYWITLTDLDPDRLYRFQYLVDETLQITDPYTELILDPWNDRWINEHALIYPDLPPYPENLTTGLVATFKINKPEFQWQHSHDFVRPSQHDLIIYELLIRDFMQNPCYERLIDTLDYLQNLGINAIGLLPNYEFDGNDSWGYNPSHMLAVDKAYGTAEGFKRFIDECHKRGIAVIMDIVLNHQTGASPLAKLYWDGNNTASNNPWFHRTATHPWNVFHQMNHRNEHTVYFTRRVVEYWMSEFGIDGFRFDLSKGFTFTGGNMEASNPVRIQYWKDLADYMWAIDPDFYVILEHFADNSEERELANHGMMLWGNLNHAFCQLAMGYSSESSLNWAFAKDRSGSRGWNEHNLIVYAESHDEERVSFKVKEWGNSNENYNTKNLTAQRMALVACFWAPLPGPKMIWQFGEFAYDIPINYCISNGTINDGCRTGRKPLLWHYLQDGAKAFTYYVYSEMNKFRLTHPAFQNQKSFTYQTAGTATDLARWIIAESNVADSSMVILGNFDIVSRSVTVPNIPANGVWYNYFGMDSITVSNSSLTITLEPGAYKVFTKVWKDNTSIQTGFNKSEIPMKIYPNPANHEIFIEFETDEQREIVLHNLSGQILQTLTTRGQQAKINVSKFQPGIYILSVTNGTQISSQKIIIQ